MGAGRSGNFGNTKGSQDGATALDYISNGLALASLIPGVDTVTDILSIPVDIARKDWLSVGFDLVGIIPWVGEPSDAAKLARITDKVSDTARFADNMSDSRKIGKTGKTAQELSKNSPIKIPKKADVKIQTKKNYSQVKYSWESGKYKYTSRWHTKTPNAPKYQGNSWVVERKIPGVGYGKNARPAKSEILVGKNKWLGKKEWLDAVAAKKQGKATEKQRKWLDEGHWKDK
mgnify:CR=1 FL=1